MAQSPFYPAFKRDAEEWMVPAASFPLYCDPQLSLFRSFGTLFAFQSRLRLAGDILSIFVDVQR